MYKLQGKGHKDLSKLILERAFRLLTKNGIISMVIPSQILSSAGSTDIRREILDREIMQLYVFENRKKIFDIDSRYRFMLLTLINSQTKKDKFPVGFYLHHLSSLSNQEQEKEKFAKHSKAKIREMFPELIIMPESTDLSTLSKMCKHPKLANTLATDGIVTEFSTCFNRSNDSDLFRKDGVGWPIHEGKTIHQYNHMWFQACIYSTI